MIPAMRDPRRARPSRGASLQDYRKKRDPNQTPEPFGGRVFEGGGLFVVQQHAARRLHYDLRLEMEGVLKSWAVPKGPSTKPHDKRLAVQVEDHPLEYADFEGVIPKGNYGAGPVIVWDRGFYRLTPGAAPLEQLGRGKLEIEFYGYKLHGTWMLVRTRQSTNEWLFFSKVSQASEKEVTEMFPESILSGLTVEQMTSPAKKTDPIREQLRALGAPIATIDARRQGFMLASLREKPFSHKQWLFEIKYDGVRVLAAKEKGSILLYSRNRNDVTARYPEITQALNTLPAASFLLDGEIIASDSMGRPSFQRLQQRMHLTNPLDIERAKRSVPLRAFFFDCLAFEDRDLRRIPLLRRKECLRLLLPARGVIQYSDHIRERGEAFFAAAWEQRLEGMIAKRITSSYAAGRTREWLKVKCQRRQEFVVGGYTKPRGSRDGFGALHLGLYQDGNLVYVSRVGTGFDRPTVEVLWSELQPLVRPTSPFTRGSPSGPDHRWVEPRLVCEVRFTEWTRQGGLRHPSFLGLRNDKPPETCVREPPVSLEPMQRLEDGSKGEISNPEKIFWPAEGYRKADLVDYYTSVAPLILPYLRDRPVVLTRFPDGIEGKSFFQKDAPDFVPSWINTQRIYSRDADRDIDYFVLNDVESLRYVINLGTIPLHIWSSQLHSLDRPNWLVLDLDPKGAPFQSVVRVAQILHRLLRKLELPSYVKTSGATGLHILIPMGRRYTHEQVRTFARILALIGEKTNPEIATLSRPLQSRGGKVYLDFGQNGYGRTIAAPFSVRPLPGATVSCPLSWNEVTTRLTPKRFTIKTVLERFAKRPDPLLSVLDENAVDLPQAVSRIQVHLGNRVKS